MNSTSCPSFVRDDPLCFAKISFPLYYSQKPNLIHPVPDFILALAAPVIAYWCLSLFFHTLDISGWKWLEKYRFHDSREVQARNLVTRSEVVWAVILQQVIQTALGIISLSDESTHVVNHVQELRRVAFLVDSLAFTTFGERISPSVVVHTTNFLYWWGVPMIQFLAAMFVIDTWQYFLHRLMHVNKFLYKHFHSWHHRLYVPYAFGSLYNHPLEGLLLDSLGALVAEWATGMTIRQAMLLFTFSSLKTVDDHCGYSLPWDPLQWLTGNNADYHDIHHQAIGIKSNFSQPFFVHWDALLGTRMTRKDIERHRKNKTQ
jgi:sphinganine C4-monooxygenase